MKINTKLWNATNQLIFKLFIETNNTKQPTNPVPVFPCHHLTSLYYWQFLYPQENKNVLSFFSSAAVLFANDSLLVGNIFIFVSTYICLYVHIFLNGAAIHKNNL